MSTSIFSPENGNKVLTMSLNEAKEYLLQIVNSAQGPRMATKIKVQGLIRRQNSTVGLAGVVYSWVLAHQSEGLKVV